MKSSDLSTIWNFLFSQASIFMFSDFILMALKIICSIKVKLLNLHMRKMLILEEHFTSNTVTYDWFNALNLFLKKNLTDPRFVGLILALFNSKKASSMQPLSVHQINHSTSSLSMHFELYNDILDYYSTWNGNHERRRPLFVERPVVIGLWVRKIHVLINRGKILQRYGLQHFK